MDGRQSRWVAWGMLLGVAGCGPLGSNFVTGGDQATLVDERFVAKPDDDSPMKPETLVRLAQTQVDSADHPNRTPQERMAYLEEGRVLYQQALAAQPDYLPALTGLGNLYLKLGDHQRALQQYQRATESNPNNVDLWHEYAMVQARMRNWEGAIHALEAGLGVDPESRACAKTMGMCLLTTGRTEEGYQWLLRAMSEAEARFNVAQALHHQGQAQASWEQLHLALRADPNHLGAHEMLSALTPTNAGEVERVGFARPEGNFPGRDTTGLVPLDQMPRLQQIPSGPTPPSPVAPLPVMTDDLDDRAFTQLPILPPAPGQEELLNTTEVPKVRISLHPR